MNTKDYLALIGVPDYPPRTVPFDPGYDANTVVSHLEQSAHLMAGLKISMACWQIANEDAIRRKIDACRRHGVYASVGGGPLEVAAAFGQLREYLELCAGLGIGRVEAGEGFVKNDLKPRDVIRMAADLGLEVQFELGEKHSGAFTEAVVSALLQQGDEWLSAGATQLVVEARENAANVGLFDDKGAFDSYLADRFYTHFGTDRVIFEAPTKYSQFELLRHFGPDVNLGNVRLEELQRVEIYRRGLHSDAFQHKNLRPAGPPKSKMAS